MNKKSAAFIVSIMLLGFIGPAFYGEAEKDYILAANTASFSSEDMPIRPKQFLAFSAIDVRKEIARAKKSLNAKRYSEAISILENTKRQGVSEMEVDQLLAMAYVNYSYIQMQEGKITSEEFIAFNKKAYDLDQNRPEASYNLAVTLGKKGNIEEGVKWLEKAYPLVIKDKNKSLLKSIRNDADLNSLRGSAEFNSRFPQLALLGDEREKREPTKPQEGQMYGKKEAALAKSVAHTGEQPYMDPETGVKFCIGKIGINRFVTGGVPESIDLTDDSMAKKLLSKGFEYWNRLYPKAVKKDAGVLLYRGECRYLIRGDTFDKPWVKGYFRAGRLDDNDYENYAKTFEEARKRFNEFVKKNGITHWPSYAELGANPFIYVDKVIAVALTFDRMDSPTEGYFSSHTLQEFFCVVSDLPKGLLTSSDKRVLIAGQVKGKKGHYIQIKYVDSHFCADFACSDISPK